MRPTACPTVLFVVLLMVAQPLFMMPSNAYPYLSVSIDTFSPRTVVVEIPVDPSRHIQFLTNVSLTDPNHYPLEMNISASVGSGSGWSVSVVPEHMTFNSTGKQKVLITASPLKNFTSEYMIYVTLDAIGTYENTDIEATNSARIYIAHHHAIDVTFRFVKKEQYMNQIDFDLTNKGTGEDYLKSSCQCYSDNYQISFTPFYATLSMNGPPSTISMKVQYQGGKFPMTYTLPIRFISTKSGITGNYYFVETNVTVSFTAPDTTQQNYLFVGAIGAFVIVMVVVLVIVLRGPGKEKK